LAIYDPVMSLPPGLAQSRRPIAIVCAAFILVAVVGALVFASLDTGNGCGSGWSAVRKPFPSPVFTPQELAVLEKDRKINRYQARLNKTRPVEQCRRAGAKRLITAGLGAGLVLLGAGGVVGYLYYPRREELATETSSYSYQPTVTAPPVRSTPVRSTQTPVEPAETPFESPKKDGWHNR